MSFTLTPFARSDAGALLAIFRDPHIRRYLLDDTFVEQEWVDAEISASEARFARGSLGLFAARDAQGVLFGFAGFRPFFEPPVLQLLYGLLPAYTGRGLATELARRCVVLAFAHGLDPIRASVDAPNVRSQRVLERLGFRLERDGPQRHHVLAADGLKP